MTAPQLNPFQAPAPRPQQQRRPRDPAAGLVKYLDGLPENEFDAAYLDHLDPTRPVLDSLAQAAFRSDRIIERTRVAVTRLASFVSSPGARIGDFTRPEMARLRSRITGERTQLGVLVEEKRAAQRAKAAKANAPKLAREILSEVHPAEYADIREKIKAGVNPAEIKAELLRAREERPEPRTRPRRRSHRRRRAAAE